MAKAKEFHKRLRERYPTADALYEDTIVNMVGEEGLAALREFRLIECCAVIFCRKLYAI